MQIRGSNRNLRKANTPAENTETKWEATGTPEIDSRQLKILTVEGPQENCWLVDSATNVHVCNNQLLITEYRERPTKIGGSISDGVSPGRGKIRLRLALKDDSERLIPNLQNIYYVPNSLCNLVSLGLLNESGIYHDNKNEILYQV